MTIEKYHLDQSPLKNIDGPGRDQTWDLITSLTHILGNGPVQRVEVEESTWHKWLKNSTHALPNPNAHIKF